jgi:hypothetical protein
MKTFFNKIFAGFIWLLRFLFPLSAAVFLYLTIVAIVPGSFSDSEMYSCDSAAMLLIEQPEEPDYYESRVLSDEFGEITYVSKDNLRAAVYILESEANLTEGINAIFADNEDDNYEEYRQQFADASCYEEYVGSDFYTAWAIFAGLTLVTGIVFFVTRSQGQSRKVFIAYAVIGLLFSLLALNSLRTSRDSERTDCTAIPFVEKNTEPRFAYPLFYRRFEEDPDEMIERRYEQQLAILESRDISRVTPIASSALPGEEDQYEVDSSDVDWSITEEEKVKLLAIITERVELLTQPEENLKGYEQMQQVRKEYSDGKGVECVEDANTLGAAIVASISLAVYGGLGLWLTRRTKTNKQ